MPGTNPALGAWGHNAFTLGRFLGMGLLIVLIVGTIMGWLAAILVDRDDRLGTPACAFAGCAGALSGAILADNVPLMSGVSPVQLFWSVAGALLTIVAANLAGFAGPRAAGRKI